MRSQGSPMLRIRCPFCGSNRPQSPRVSPKSTAFVLIAVLVQVGSVAPCALGTVIHVPGDQPTIQAGIDAASPGDTVLVASGTYNEHDIQMRSGIYLRSETGQPESVTIDAGGLGRVIYCLAVDSAARIDGFTLRGGAVTSHDFGGGIYCRDSYLTIANCLVTENYARDGGSGVYCGRSNIVIEECRIARNEQTVDGGGLYFDQSIPSVSYSLIYGNSAQFWGGGCFCQWSSPTLSHCTIAGNAAYEGGGVWCVYYSYPVMDATIVAFNTHGGGIFAYDQLSAPSIGCSDAFGNVGGNYAGTIDDQTGMNGNISSDPFFCGSDTGDYSLSSTSPCLPENNSCGVLMGALGEGCGPSAIPAGEGTRAAIAWSVPNPLHPGSQIAIEMRAGSEVSLSLVAPSGKVIRSLLDREAGRAGIRKLTWDGLDRQGRRTPAGVYFLRIEAGGIVETRKIILLS